MIRHAWTAVVRRRRHVAFSVTAVAVAVAAVVATLGVSHSAADNIAATLRALNGTTTSVALTAPAWREDEATLAQRLRQVSGVTAAGTLTPFPTDAAGDLAASSTRAPTAAVPLVVVTAGGIHARGARLVAGRPPSDVDGRADPSLVVVGRAAAQALAVAPQPGLDRVQVGGRPMRVVGIVDDAEGESALTASVGISPAALPLLGRTPPGRVVVTAHHTRIDEKALAVAADPRQPDTVSVRGSLPPEALKGRIAADTAGLIAVLAVVTLVGGALGVGNTMQSAVWQRRSEIGVIRALGGSRGHVARLFLAEATIIGAAGGLAGAAVGVITGATIAWTRGWPWTLPTVALAAPALGVLLGMLAGAWPAWNASRVDPAELLRSD